MLNVVVLSGRLTADPELKNTPSNVAVTSFSIAVQRKYASGQEKVTDFIEIVAWRNTAEFVCKYFRKGQMIAIEGSIQTRSYEDKEGNKRKAFEVVASGVDFIGSKSDNETNSGGQEETKLSGTPRARQQKIVDYSNDDDGDLPF
ncbi:MAG: single-stranded DNA-binding protein [Novosphingobium sp.]|nr:single-stranded DNA-binding protein [Novosphingobium sp.]